MAKVTGITSARAEDIRGPILSGATISPDGVLYMSSEDLNVYEIGKIAEEYIPTVEAVTTIGTSGATSSDVIVPEWFKNPYPNVKLANPASPVVDMVNSLAWSPDGVFLALGIETFPFLQIYKRAADVYTELSTPTLRPDGPVKSLAWSPDGLLLACGTATGTPKLVVYSRPSGGDVLTKLSTPVVDAPDDIYSVSWSSDSVYLAIAYLGDPCFSVYKRSGGTTLTKLPDLSDITPGGDGYAVSWPPKGRPAGDSFLAIGHSTAPYLTIYREYGDDFYVLSTVPDAPTVSCWALSWSPNGQYLVFTSTAAPYLFIYKRSNEEFVLMDNPDVPPAAAVWSATWSPDGRYLALGGAGTPICAVYKLDNDVFTKIIEPTTLPTSDVGHAVGWSPDGIHMAVGMQNDAAFVHIHKSSMGLTEVIPIPTSPSY